MGEENRNGGSGSRQTFRRGLLLRWGNGKWGNTCRGDVSQGKIFLKLWIVFFFYADGLV